MTTASQPHRLCRLLRELRHAARLSLADIEKKYGIPSVVLGAYERGDRIPPLYKLDHILSLYGYRLEAFPIGTTSTRLPATIVADLRAIADQLDIPDDVFPDDPLEEPDVVHPLP